MRPCCATTVLFGTTLTFIQDLQDTFDFEVVSLAVRDGSVDAGADAYVRRNSLYALGMDGSMTIVDSLGHL